MSENSKIEWCHHTFNPWWGCIEVSPACDNCYARTFANRVGQKVWGPAAETPRRFFADKHWLEPLKWNQKAAEAGERHRVFCASMADVFEQNDALDGERQRLWGLINLTPHLDWLLLTKRPQNIRRMVPPEWLKTPQPNVWYGTTVEDQHYADQRIPILLEVPAAIRFLSMEPLLGPVDLSRIDYSTRLREVLLEAGAIKADDEASRTVKAIAWLDVLHGEWFDGWDSGADGKRIDWIITGGESGHGARPADPDWYRSLRDQCQEAGVPFHFKQWGDLNETGERVGKKAAGRILDGRTWDQFPAAPAGVEAARS